MSGRAGEPESQRAGNGRDRCLISGSPAFWLSGFVLLAAANVTRAELPSIRFDRLTPLGASAGATIDAEINGSDIDGVATLLFDHPGLSATPIEGMERWFRITVAADVPTGTYDVRLVGRWGVSNPRLFAVSRGLKDVAEAEPNNEIDKAQVIEVNSAVAGSSDGNNEDFFRFAAKAGQRVVIDCQAGKLDSLLDATMTLATAQGKVLATSGDYNGRDPMIVFAAPSDGEYLVRVFDLSYRGGYPYRLLVTDKPYIVSMSPRAVQDGKQTEMTAVGYNLGPGASPAQTVDSDVPLESIKFAYAAPPDVLAQAAYRFSSHPTDHSVLPTGATSTLIGAQVRPPNDEAIGGEPVVVTDTPVVNETEPNDTLEKPQPVALPLMLSGRFDKPRDADWFEFEAPASGSYSFDVYCERIHGNADPYLVIVDEQGNRIQELDDFGIRTNAFDGHLRDPVGNVNLTEKKKYRVLVQDRYRRGGDRYQYVLAVRQAKPDFLVSLIHSQNPGPGGVTLWRGGSVYIDAILHQQSYSDEVTLTSENLPAGVHAMPTVINNNSRGVFVLWADDDAADFVGPIKLIATGKRGDEVIRHEARYTTRVWTESNKSGSRPTRETIVAVRDGAPYRLEWERDEVEVEAGKSADLKLRLVRRWPEFKNEVTIQALAFPGNFNTPNSSFGGDQTEKTVSISVQGNTRPGRYTLAVLGQAQVPFNKDPSAKDKPNTLVSLPSRPVTLVVKAAAK